MKQASSRYIAMLAVACSLLPSWPASAQCQGSNLNDISFLLGSWESVSNTKQTTLQTEIIAQGCAFARKQQTDSAAESFDSIIYVEANGQIQELKVYHDGKLERYRWWQNEEEWIVELIGKAGAQKQRLIVTQQSENFFSSSLELSSNWGETWAKVGKAISFSRIAEIQPSEPIK